MVVVMVLAAVWVVFVICSNLCNCMFCGGICGVGSGSGGIDIGWVVMMVVVIVRYWWSTDGDGGDDGCCNGGSCDKEYPNKFYCWW